MTTAGLDPSFGQGGVALGPVSIDPATTYSSGSSRAVVQPDGRIVVVTGSVSGADPSPTLTVQRFDADGSLDASFGTDGSASLPVPSGRNELGTLPDVTLAPDGDIVVSAGLSEFSAQSGTDPNTEESIIVRLTSDGRLDPTFAQGGEYVDSQPGAQVSRVVVQADGRIVAGGTTGLEPLFSSPNGKQQITLIRLNTDGTLDPSFAGTGTLDIVPQALNTYAMDSLSGLAIAPDGRIVVASDLSDFADPLASTPSATLLTRINTDGTFDASFGAGGTVDTSQQIANISGLVVQPDGALVVAGGIPLPATSTGGLYPMDQPMAGGLVRYLPDGTVDPSFQTAATETSLNDLGISVLALGADGEFTVAGSFYQEGPSLGNGTYGPGHEETMVGRFLADGTPDLGFAAGGILTFAVTPTPIAGQDATEGIFEPLSASVTPAGKILLANQLGISTTDAYGDMTGTAGRQLALVQVLPSLPLVVEPAPITPTPTPPITINPAPVAPPVGPASPITINPGPVVAPPPIPISIEPGPVVAPPVPPPASTPTTSTPVATPTSTSVTTPVSPANTSPGTTADSPAAPAAAPMATPTPAGPLPVAIPVARSSMADKALKHSQHVSHLRRSASHSVSHPVPVHHAARSSAPRTAVGPAEMKAHPAPPHRVAAKHRSRQG